MTRDNFDLQLAQVKEKLVNLASMVNKVQEQAVRALAEHDAELAKEVISSDQTINHMQREIEETCLLLIASQQPVARDLRLVFSMSTIAWELERMADHAKGVAVLAQRLADQPLLKPLIDIPRMAEIGRELLMGQIDAFIRGDADAARAIAVRDNEVDQLNDQVFRELLVFMMTDPRTITRATYLLWVAHNLERFADRTTNIGERVVFLQTNSIVELNE
ncbi:MAG: phosphate signaling complex protein PhoU [Anaerolineae bacterium]|nr:phosphate signaling complex protein PhoU [Anaerolineae bacterium]